MMQYDRRRRAMDDSTHHFHHRVATNAECMNEHLLEAAIDFFNMSDQELEPAVFERVLRILTTDSSDPVRCYRMVSEVLKDFPGLSSRCRRFFELELGANYMALPEGARNRMMRELSKSDLGEAEKEVLNVDVKLKKRECSGVEKAFSIDTLMMHQCEDEQFEMDMLIATVRAAIARLEKYQIIITKGGGGGGGGGGGNNIEEHMKGADRRCIEQIYDKAGEIVLRMLAEDPTKVLPVVLGRLKQKEGEWVQCRSQMISGWNQVFEDHYYPSLGLQKPCQPDLKDG